MRRSKLTCWLSSLKSSLQPTTITGAFTYITEQVIYLSCLNNKRNASKTQFSIHLLLVKCHVDFTEYSI